MRPVAAMSMNFTHCTAYEMKLAPVVPGNYECTGGSTNVVRLLMHKIVPGRLQLSVVSLPYR